MKALLILSVLLSVCSARVLRKRSLLGGHNLHHHRPLPHRGPQRNLFSSRHFNQLQDVRQARSGDLGGDHHEHHGHHSESDVRAAPDGYLPPPEDYQDDLTGYGADDDLSGYSAS